MSMRPHIFCLVEGYSEKNFIHGMVAKHLSRLGIDITAPMVMTSFNPKLGKKSKGGGDTFNHWSRDLGNLWRQHGGRAGTHFTTMVDLFRLPSDFPGVSEVPRHLPFRVKVAQLEKELADHVEGLGVHSGRFTPYIAAHEFETMAFANLDALGTLFLEDQCGIERLRTEVAGIADIESINSSPEGAPSMRIGKYIPVYNKYKRSDQSGIVNVLEVIELPTIRRACLHLHEWLTQLETLAP
jgi:Domain of unknown function (DUF4276)